VSSLIHLVQIQSSQLRSLSNWVAFGLLALFAASDSLAQGVDLMVDAQEAGILPAILRPMNSRVQILQQTRGLIQNELSIINDFCGLDEKQKQVLVDLAESEWKAKTNATVIKRAQEHVYGMVDLDSLAERVVRTWLEATSRPEQLSRYDEELADRFEWRKKAFVSRVLDNLQTKLNLSGVQMEQVEVILMEKWKDRWFRSLEATFDSSIVIAEIRQSWINPLLSEAQVSAFAQRDTQPRIVAFQELYEAPTFPLDERFSVGATKSSDSIAIESVPKKVILGGARERILEELKKSDEELDGGLTDAIKP